MADSGFSSPILLSNVFISSPRSTDSDSSKLGFLFLNESKHFYYFEYDDEKHDGSISPVDSIRRFNLTPPFGSSHYKVLCSLNGLVCLYKYVDPSAYCICNPLTKEYVKLPEFNRDSSSYRYITRGFGYLPLSNEYKVVQIDMLRTDLSVVEVMVYTIGSGNGWRNVGRFDIQSGEAGYFGNGVFLNGALHWMEIDEGRVFVFDLTEEKFYKHVPPLPSPPGSQWYEYTSIGVLGGVWYYAIGGYCPITERVYNDIWPLKVKNEFGDTKEEVEQEPLSWSKGFGFPRRQPFSFTKSGGVLYFDDMSLGIYDTISSTSKELVRFTAVRQIYPHKKTFVSLKELGEDGVKIMDAAKLTEDRKPSFPTKELAR